MAKGMGNGRPFDKMAGYYQTGLTGTGSSQNVPHTLGVVPTLVLAQLRDNDSKTLVQGTHTATNLVFTVTNAAVFDVWALPASYPG